MYLDSICQTTKSKRKTSLFPFNLRVGKCVIHIIIRRNRCFWTLKRCNHFDCQLRQLVVFGGFGGKKVSALKNSFCHLHHISWWLVNRARCFAAASRAYFKHGKMMMNEWRDDDDMILIMCVEPVVVFHDWAEKHRQRQWEIIIRRK